VNTCNKPDGKDLPTRSTYYPESWSYTEAFSRHRGLITVAEQARLKQSCVAIIGAGGVGGVHLMTLARLGIGAFRIADPDHFSPANFNRQCGATISSLGKNKATIMAEQARAVNPDVKLQVFPQAITRENVADFLDGADILVDGIDFFAIQTRRLLFSEARRRGLWAVTAGPVGFSTAWLVFSPTGISFDDYFDLCDSTPHLDQLIAFAVGLAPRASHLPYLDLSQVNIDSETGPSAGLACNLCSGVAAAEVLKILLGRKPVRPAPHFCQFDAYRGILRKGRLLFGNRGPWQRLKRWWLRKKFA